jgi:hypothetical protein
MHMRAADGLERAVVIGRSELRYSKPFAKTVSATVWNWRIMS